MVFPNKSQKKVCACVLFHTPFESFTVALTLDLKEKFLNPILLLQGSFCSFLTIDTLIFLPLKSQWTYLQGGNRRTVTGKMSVWDKLKKQHWNAYITTRITGS